MSVLVGVCGRSMVDHVETITFSVIDFCWKCHINSVRLTPALRDIYVR